jgi:hypothetical protein
VLVGSGMTSVMLLLYSGILSPEAPQSWAMDDHQFASPGDVCLVSSYIKYIKVHLDGRRHSPDSHVQHCTARARGYVCAADSSS